jgi:hypothetical protein
MGAYRRYIPCGCWQQFLVCNTHHYFLHMNGSFIHDLVFVPSFRYDDLAKVSFSGSQCCRIQKTLQTLLTIRILSKSPVPRYPLSKSRIVFSNILASSSMMLRLLASAAGVFPTKSNPSLNRAYSCWEKARGG